MPSSSAPASPSPNASSPLCTKKHPVDKEPRQRCDLRSHLVQRALNAQLTVGASSPSKHVPLLCNAQRVPPPAPHRLHPRLPHVTPRYPLRAVLVLPVPDPDLPELTPPPAEELRHRDIWALRAIPSLLVPCWDRGGAREGLGHQWHGSRYATAARSVVQDRLQATLAGSRQTGWMLGRDFKSSTSHREHERRHRGASTRMEEVVVCRLWETSRGNVRSCPTHLPLLGERRRVPPASRDFLDAST